MTASVQNQLETFSMKTNDEDLELIATLTGKSEVSRFQQSSQNHQLFQFESPFDVQEQQNKEPLSQVQGDLGTDSLAARLQAINLQQ